MVAARRTMRRQQQFQDRVREMAQRHQDSMIRRAVTRHLNVPLHYYDYSFWWLRRCGFCDPEYAGQFTEIWRWWKGLDLMAQHALMRFNRRFGTSD